MIIAETMKAMFTITHFSPKGLAKEEATYMLFVDFLYDCECVGKGINYYSMSVIIRLFMIYCR